jgi:flagellar biosynthesis component FlhA
VLCRAPPVFAILPPQHLPGLQHRQLAFLLQHLGSPRQQLQELQQREQEKREQEKREQEKREQEKREQQEQEQAQQQEQQSGQCGGGPMRDV